MAQDMALARALHESLNAEAPPPLPQQYSSHMLNNNILLGGSCRGPSTTKPSKINSKYITQI